MQGLFRVYSGFMQGVWIRSGGYVAPKRSRVSGVGSLVSGIRFRAEGCRVYVAPRQRAHPVVDSPGGVPREQKMLKGHLPRVIYHQVY